MTRRLIVAVVFIVAFLLPAAAVWAQPSIPVTLMSAEKKPPKGPRHPRAPRVPRATFAPRRRTPTTTKRRPPRRVITVPATPPPTPPTTEGGVYLVVPPPHTYPLETVTTTTTTVAAVVPYVAVKTSSGMSGVDIAILLAFAVTAAGSFGAAFYLRYRTPREIDPT